MSTPYRQVNARPFRSEVNTPSNLCEAGATHFPHAIERFAGCIGRTKVCSQVSPIGGQMTASVKVFGCRPFIDHCCPPRQGRRSKTSKEGNRESEGRRRRCDLWGFESRWRLLSSGRNDYQRRFRRIERSEGVFSGGNGIIFFAAAVFARGARSIIGRAPPARRQKRAELRRGG